MYFTVDLGDSIKVCLGYLDSTQLARFDLACKISSRLQDDLRRCGTGVMSRLLLQNPRDSESHLLSRRCAG